MGAGRGDDGVRNKFVVDEKWNGLNGPTFVISEWEWSWRTPEGNGDREGLVRRRVRYFRRYGPACAVRRLPGRAERVAERVCKAETRS
jgi:hypothetical protein